MALEIWVLVVLVCGPVFGGAPVRQQRQADWWRHYQRPIPAQGSPRGSNRESVVRPLVGLGSLRGSTQYRRGPSNLFSGALPRQLEQEPASSPIRIQCTEDTIEVMVNRDFYENGILVQPSELSLGTQSCEPSKSNDTTVHFSNNLQDCGNTLQVTKDYLIYSSILTYSPLANEVIIRSSPAVVPIKCIFSRYGNVSSKAIVPTWSPFSTTVSSHEKLFFSLHLMNEDWSVPRSSSVFQLGQSLNIEASVDIQNHISLILFVDSCVATISLDPNSTPRYELIADNGCFVDAMRDDTSSAFRSPRIQPDKLQFTIEAFRFWEVEESVIYITCNLRAVSASQAPNAVNKACSYNRGSNSWSPVEGSSNICQCCATGDCGQLPQGSSLGNLGRPRGAGRPRVVGRPRDHQKRHVGHHSEKHGQAILGPLLMISAEDHPAPRTGLSRVSRTASGSQPLEKWVLVAVASISLVAVPAGVAWIVKLLNKRSCKAVEK
ncbi:zona pellucida sperm-binding protein 3-like [Lithobates pipiens]